MLMDLKEEMQQIKSIRDKKSIQRSIVLFNESLGSHIMLHTVAEDGFKAKNRFHSKIMAERKEQKRIKKEMQDLHI